MFYSKDLAYINVPALVLLLAGLLLSIYAFVRNKDVLLRYGIKAALVGIVLGVILLLIPSYNDTDISNGLHWSECKVIEENAFNGLFDENVNKLDCDGIIKNIPISIYTKSIYAFSDKKLNENP